MLLSRVSQMALKLTGRGNALVQTMHTARLAMPQGVQSLPSVAGRRALSVRAGTLCLCGCLNCSSAFACREWFLSHRLCKRLLLAAIRASETGSSVNDSANAFSQCTPAALSPVIDRLPAGAAGVCDCGCNNARFAHSKPLLCVLSAIGIYRAPRLHAALYITTGTLR